MKSQPKPFQYLFVIIAAAGTLTLGFTLYQTEWSNHVVNLLIFAVIAVASESLPVALSNGGYVSVSFAVFFAAVILFPPGVALSVAALGGLLVVRRPKYPLFKRVFNGAQYVISLQLGAMVLSFLGVTGFVLSLRSILAYFLAAFVYMVVNMTTVALALAFMQGKSPRAIWLGNIRWSVPNYLALSLLGLLMALIVKNYGPQGLVLLSVPLLFSRYSFQRYVDMRENYFSTIEALVKAIEAKDKYTRGHSDRVARYAVAIARELKLPEDKIECIRFMGILHDLGKIGICETILNKEECLLDNEWEVIRNHPVIGETIIKDIKFLYKIGPGVRHHHERYDGRGYPDRLQGQEIPLEARIIAVADCYDAMTSDRSYRRRRSRIEALQELSRVTGSQLDPGLVEVFCRVVPDEEVTEAPAGCKEIICKSAG